MHVVKLDQCVTVGVQGCVAYHVTQRVQLVKQTHSFLFVLRKTKG